MTTQGGLVLVGLVVLAGLAAVAAFRSGARGAYKVARQTQEVTRMGGNLARALGTAAVIVAVQWAIVTFTPTRAPGVWYSGYRRCSPEPRSHACSR